MFVVKSIIIKIDGQHILINDKMSKICGTKARARKYSQLFDFYVTFVVFLVIHFIFAM